ncbi:MAG: SIS domain-containing protein [Chloroflexi bacterium]|nr:SIS domain-containing protein [Chloroflexota bacterium]
MREELSEDAHIKLALARDSVGVIAEIARTLVRTYQHGGKVVLFGNGGSAADAQHIAAELVGRLLLPHRPAMPAIALTVNTSVLTAIANDFGYESLFARQVEALVASQDVVIALSTSGNSPNVIAGVRAAKAKGAATVGFTGAHGAKLAQCVDLILRVPSSNTQRVQEAHITIGHILCGLVERALFEIPDTGAVKASQPLSLGASVSPGDGSSSSRGKDRSRGRGVP